MEKSPQIFHTAKYHLGKTRKQSSCIPEISSRLWILILGKREVKTDYFFSPLFFILFAQQLRFWKKPSSEWHWIAFLSTSWWERREFIAEQGGGRTQPPASPRRRLSRADGHPGAEGAQLFQSRPCHVSDPTPAKRPVGGETRPGCLHLDLRALTLIHLMMSGTWSHSARPGLAVGLKPRLAFLGRIPRSRWGRGWSVPAAGSDAGDGLWRRLALRWPVPPPRGEPHSPRQAHAALSAAIKPPAQVRRRRSSAALPRVPHSPSRRAGEVPGRGAAGGAAPWSGTARRQRRHAAPPGGAITARPRPRGRGGVSPLASPQRRGPQGFPPRRGGPAPARPPCER